MMVRANEVRSTGPTFDHWPSSLPQVAYTTADGARRVRRGGNGRFLSLEVTSYAQLAPTQTPGTTLARNTMDRLYKRVQ